MGKTFIHAWEAANKMMEEGRVKLDKPTEPCFLCKSDDWYWPGDRYWGPKSWICGVCHPAPENIIELKETK